MLIAESVIREVNKHGVRDFIICPGARNAPLIFELLEDREIDKLFFNDERSAAFFALGRARFSPAAVVTTSGTAAGELLPAAMEAYHSGLPLVLITADRPRELRFTGAPQTCNQVGIFAEYVLYQQDLTDGEQCDLKPWSKKGPCHLNVCLGEM